jgi:hypothetical protein
LGKPVTLLEGLCGHAVSFGAYSIEVERKEGNEWVFAREPGGERFRIGCYPSTGSNGQELRGDLAAALKKPRRAVFNGRVYLLTVCTSESFGEGAFTVEISPAPKPDPSIAPSFTAKQGQYLAFIYNYTKIHRCAPAESDLQYYFRVSPPSIHEMIKTLERNGLIEKTPGQARSIRVLVQPEHLPKLG